MKIDVIYVEFQSLGFLLKSIEYLGKAVHGFDAHVVVVDNSSSCHDLSNQSLFFEKIHIQSNSSNIGFGRANNQAIHSCHAPYVLLINTDAFIREDSLRTTLDYMDRNPDCGILGVKLVGQDGSLQPSCRYFPTPLNLFLRRSGLARFFPFVRLVDDMDWAHDEVRECDWVPGCYFLIRREVIDQVGLFDPRYFLYYEEVDLCLAAKKAGWKVVFYPYTEVVHLGGESAKTVGQLSDAGKQLSELQMESEHLYFRKNHGLHAVLVNAALFMVAEIINIAKRAVRRRPLLLRHSWKDVQTMLKTLVATRLGAVPVR